MAEVNPVPTVTPSLLRILIIEDSAPDAELMVATVRGGGYEVEFDVADTPWDFRERLAKAEYDVILADYNLHSWTALDALRILRQSGKDTPLIVTTGSLGDEAAVECIKQGAEDFVLKDRPARLPLAIQRALEEKRLREQGRRVEEALVKLRQAVDASGEVVFMTDREGVFTFVNPEFTRLYGYTENEVVGKLTPRILKSGALQQEEYADFWHTILDKRVAKGEIVNKTKDGRLVTLASSANPILDEQGNITGFLAIQRDVTGRKHLEDQLRQAQKMEAVGRLAGGVAHDFNNLLTIIAGYGQLLLEALPEKDPLRTQVAEVLKASERATSLTRQLLAFGRRQVLAPRVLDLNAVIADTEKMLRRLIGEDIELVTVPGRDLGNVKADPGQIEQVILNLAVNARDAMPEGGRLTIETSNTILDEAYANQHVSVQPGPYVMLAVSDTGHGMDPETQTRMFEPFFTTKEKGKGTGLGLATVYGIVKQSGGYIWVYSEMGQGTAFKIYFPRIQPGVGATVAPRAESASTGGTETILLVEDDHAVRSLVHAVLEPRGYKVLVARNGDEALFLCEQHKGPIHLLLTDVVMPGISGRELAERLSPLHREMRVLYMSGYTDNAIVHHGVLDANVKFLQKPFSPASLAHRVRTVLDEGK